jgi:hypothetical protein
VLGLPKYSKSIKLDKQILETLAQEGEFGQYAFPELLGVDYTTVLRHLQDLKKNYYIKIKRFEPASKGGKEKNIYELTKIGFFYILMVSDKVRSDIPKLAQIQKEKLPHIFGKWELFQCKGFEKEAIERLLYASTMEHEYLIQMFFTEFSGKNPLYIRSGLENHEETIISASAHVIKDAKENQAKYIEWGINREFFFPDFIEVNLDKSTDLSEEKNPELVKELNFLLKISTDPDLNKLVTGILLEQIKEKKSEFEILKKWLDLWKDLKVRNMSPSEGT